MIEIRNISRTYKMGDELVYAAKNISFNIQAGEFVVLRGSSGSGKSTIMNILGCLDSNFEGEYLLNSNNIRKLDENRLSVIRNKQIGFIHQNFNLLPRSTAFENVELPLIYAGISRSQRKEKAIGLLSAVGLKDRLSHLPFQMSGGQQQRVAVARAIANDAKLILADEPTGNLDSKSGVEVMTILSRLNERGVTIILVTHDNEVADWATRSIYFKDGHLGS